MCPVDEDICIFVALGFRGCSNWGFLETFVDAGVDEVWSLSVDFNVVCLMSSLCGEIV